LAALDEGRFDTAQQLLSEARRAVDSLGDAYEGASAIRQGAREAEVITQLVPASLEELLDEAARTDPQEWAERFRKLYLGRTIIPEAQITAVPDSQGRGGYDLDYRIIPPGEGARGRSPGRIDTTGFKLFEDTKPRVGNFVLFGARLASFRLDRQ